MVRLNQVYRREQKYLLPLTEAAALCAYLSKVLHPDSHNGAEGYPVRSLYFDTPDNRDYHEKEDGCDPRKKLRLRIYGCDSPFGLLEMKQKQGVSQRKRSLRLAREDAVQAAAGNYSCLLRQNEPFAQECFSVLNVEAYRPKTIVSYRRKAFVLSENHIRITFDSDIRATESRLDLFDQCLGLYPVFDQGLTVLEVKYNGFLLSYVQQAVDHAGKSAQAVSKYTLGRLASLKSLY